MFKSKIYIAIYYSSIFFLALYLINTDMLAFSHFKLNLNFYLSLLLLTSGFFTYPLVLNKVLKSQGISSSYLVCFISLGNTIFSKYIPGKVAMVYSIAFNINKNNNAIGVTRLSYNVILFQILILVGGLLTGLFAVIQLDKISSIWKIGSAVVIILSLALLQSVSFFKKISSFISHKLGKKIAFPHFKKKDIFVIIAASIIFWLLWGAGMYFLVLSSDITIASPSSLIFLFPFSVCVGILAIIAPGGIGIREGVFALLIISLGNPVRSATEITVLSRIWFILGEIILFSVSHIIAYLYLKSEKGK
jgi:uncharacterized membrane protein YbhN (UPF0104 family)